MVREEFQVLREVGVGFERHRPVLLVAEGQADGQMKEDRYPAHLPSNTTHKGLRGGAAGLRGGDWMESKQVEQTGNFTLR